MRKLLLFSLLLVIAAACNNQGPPGPAGPTGNANVISTEAIVLNTWFYDQTSNWYAADINMPEITRDVVDFGLVMVYQRLQSGSNPVWIPLPDTYNNVTNNYDFYRGGITVYSFKVDNSTPIAPTGMVVRAVVIPANMRKANPETNWHNYAEVQKLLNLPD